METGLLLNLGLTTAVQTVVGTGLALIMKRYVAAVDKLADRVKELEEKRISELEKAARSNRSEHEELKTAIAGRITRTEQRELVARIEKVSDEQRGTAIQQTRTATKMSTATDQISELFGRIAKLSSEVSHMQGKLGD